MTIRISATVALLKPHCYDSGQYYVTTARAIATISKEEELEFELKFFYNHQSTDNTVPDTYQESEAIHFTGNLTEFVNGLLCVNVQQAHSLGMITPPQHCVEVNLNGQIRTPPKNTATSSTTSTTSADPSSAPQPTNFTTFETTATQWVSQPRNDKSNQAKNSYIDFDFVVHHPKDSRLASRTSNLTQGQNVNILGLLEVVDDQLFVQLTDVSWTTTTKRPSASPSKQSSSKRDNKHAPILSTTRALAASLMTSKTSTSKSVSTSEKQIIKESSTSQSNQETPNPPPKKKSRKHTNPPSTSNSTESQDNVSIDDCTNSQPTHNRTLRSSKRTASKTQVDPDSTEGNEFTHFSELTMVGGIPQPSNTQNAQSNNKITKLRDYATSVLPKRPFSFT